MIEQLELTAYRPHIEADEVSRLVDLLHAAGTWMTAHDILEQLGLPVTESAKRHLRELAEHSQGEIVSGNSGYKHNRHITPEELDEFWGRMVSQGKKMIARALLVKRKHHSYVG